MIHKNILIIGTSHIAKQSLDEIKQKFEQFQPDIIAIELDKQRLAGLMSNQKGHVGIRDILRIGIKGYAFAALGGYLQRKLGAVVGVAPGSEMKLAAQIAQQHKKQLALIDQNIELTLKKLSKRISWKEKFRFVWDIIRSIFAKKKVMKEIGIEEFDLAKIPTQKLIKKLMKQMKKNYPNVYSVLVDERNKIMANNATRLSLKNPESRIMVVIGAGHEEGFLEELKRRDEGKVDVIVR